MRSALGKLINSESKDDMSDVIKNHFTNTKLLEEFLYLVKDQADLELIAKAIKKW